MDVDGLAPVWRRHLATAQPGSCTRRNENPRPARTATRKAAGQRSRAFPLRRSGGVLSPVAGQPADVFVWVLSERRRRNRAGTDTTAGISLPEAAAEARRQRLGRRLRLGRVCTLRSTDPWGSRTWDYAEPAPGRGGESTNRGGRLVSALPCRGPRC